jgi:hypothetical protein
MLYLHTLVLPLTSSVHPSCSLGGLGFWSLAPVTFSEDHPLVSIVEVCGNRCPCDSQKPILTREGVWRLSDLALVLGDRLRGGTDYSAEVSLGMGWGFPWGYPSLASPLLSPTFPHSLTDIPGSISSRNHLPRSLWLMTCFQGTWPKTRAGRLDIICTRKHLSFSLLSMCVCPKLPSKLGSHIVRNANPSLFSSFSPIVVLHLAHPLVSSTSPYLVIKLNLYSLICLHSFNIQQVLLESLSVGSILVGTG